MQIDPIPESLPLSVQITICELQSYLTSPTSFMTFFSKPEHFPSLPQPGTNTWIGVSSCSINHMWIIPHWQSYLTSSTSFTTFHAVVYEFNDKAYHKPSNSYPTRFLPLHNNGLPPIPLPALRLTAKVRPRRRRRAGHSFPGPEHTFKTTHLERKQLPRKQTRSPAYHGHSPARKSTAAGLRNYRYGARVPHSTDLSGRFGWHERVSPAHVVHVQRVCLRRCYNAGDRHVITSLCHLCKQTNAISPSYHHTFFRNTDLA